MAQLTDDRFAAGDAPMTIDAALALVLPRLTRTVESETLALGETLGWWAPRDWWNRRKR
jgi:hypothetical protein